MSAAARLLDGLAVQVAGWSAVPGATPEPSPGVDTLDPNAVTPGVLGFLVIFAVVLACIPLFLSMTGKLRRVEHRARLEGDDAGAGPEAVPDAPPATGPRRTATDGTAAQDARTE